VFNLQNWFQNHENETVDPETVFKTEKNGPAFFKNMVFELGLMGKSLFILESLNTIKVE